MQPRPAPPPPYYRWGDQGTSGAEWSGVMTKGVADQGDPRLRLPVSGIPGEGQDRDGVLCSLTYLLLPCMPAQCWEPRGPKGTSSPTSHPHWSRLCHGVPSPGPPPFPQRDCHLPIADSEDTAGSPVCPGPPTQGTAPRPEVTEQAHPQCPR